jgi:hypothetical protein
MDMRVRASFKLPVVVDTARPQRRRLRVAVVTETYPPEVNGVALTLERIVRGLRERGHAVQVVRPRQPTGDDAVDANTLLTRGLPIPGYPDLRMGVPGLRALHRVWTHRRPDLVHIATEGPLGRTLTTART